MAIVINCPSCDSAFNLGEDMAGKKVKCQKCQHVFMVPKDEDKARPDAVTAKPKPPKVAADDDDDDAPSRNGTKKPPPTSKSSSRSSKGRKQPAESSGMGMIVLLIVLLGGGFLGCAGCATGIGWWYLAEQKPDGDPGPIAQADKKPTDVKVDGVKADVGNDRDKLDAFKDRDRFDDLKDRDKFDPFKDKDRFDPFKDKDKFDPFKDRDKFDGLKDLPPFDGKKDFFKDLPPFDGKKDGFKDKVDPPLPGATTVVFGPDGSYTSNSRIDASDPFGSFDGFGKKRHKVYVAQMEAGQSYQIDMKAAFEFDAYLYVQDGFKTLAQDDDSGGAHNARIVFRPQRSGPYRIIATSLFGDRFGPFTLTVRRQGGPVVKGDPLPDPVTVGDITHRIFTPTKGVAIMDGLIWARDGKTFYVLNQNGLIQRINPSTGNTDQQHDHARKAGNLALSGEGLLVTMTDAQEVWVIDPENLGAVKKKIPVPSVARVAAGIDSKYAVAGGVGGFGNSGLSLIDLQRGAVLQQYQRFASGHLSASPDGRYFFAQGGIEQLQRFRLEGENLLEEEGSHRIAQNGQRICVSPDGKHVCLPSGGGNYTNLPDHPPTASYSTYVYPVDNLKRPAVTIHSNAYPQALGFDPKNGLVYAQNFDKAFMVFTYTGIKRSEHTFPGVRGSDVREYSVSPLGLEVLLRAGERVVHVKLAKGGVPIGKDPDPMPKIDPKNDVGKSLLKNSLKLGAFTAKELALSPNGATPMTLTEPVWDPQGKSFYFLSQNTMYKVSRDGKVEASAQMPVPCHFLALSSEGLVTAPILMGQVFLIDPKTMQVRAKINTPTAKWLGASPGSSTALVFDNEFSFVDLKAGRSLPAQVANMPGSLINLRSAALAPDGKTLFVQTFDYTCHRLKVETGKLVHGGSRPAIAKGIVRFQISPDSRAVVITFPTLTTLNAKKVMVTEVYPVGSFDKFAYTIPGYLKLASFDGDGAMYAVADKNEVRYYADPAARPNQFQTLALTPILPRLMLAAPQGRGSLLVASQQTYLVEPAGK